MSSGIIRGTPLLDDSNMYIHARSKFTKIYAVDVIDKYEDTEKVANNFLDFTESNNFVKKVCEENGIINGSHGEIRKQLNKFKIFSDFVFSPVTVPNLIMIFGVHTELCVTDHVEFLRQRFPKSQLLILSDLCETMNQGGGYFLFNYCLRTKHADMIHSSKLIILDEEYNEDLLE